MLIDACDLMAKIGKAGTGDETDIAGTEHHNTHLNLLNCGGKLRGGELTKSMTFPWPLDPTPHFSSQPALVGSDSDGAHVPPVRFYARSSKRHQRDACASRTTCAP